jgi:hypothetical protein
VRREGSLAFQRERMLDTVRSGPENLQGLLRAWDGGFSSQRGEITGRTDRTIAEGYRVPCFVAVGSAIVPRGTNERGGVPPKSSASPCPTGPGELPGGRYLSVRKWLSEKGLSSET